MGSELHAWCDESLNADSANPFYVFAAYLAEPDQVGEQRDAIRSLEPRPGVRFHWREAKRHERTRATEIIATLACAHIVAIAAPMDPRKQERSRHHCLKTLFAEMAAWDVTRVTLESRAAQDKNDQTFIRQLRSAHLVPKTMTVRHDRPKEEPLLWVPDIVAGATRADHLGDRTYFAAIEPMVTILNAP